jgi:hypothetical protein
VRTVRRRRLRRLPRVRGGRALWRRVRGGRALWRQVRMCALRRLALCPLRLQLLGLRGTLLDMGRGLDIHLLTRQPESSRKSTGGAACPIASRLREGWSRRSCFDMSGIRRASDGEAPATGMRHAPAVRRVARVRVLTS